MNRRKPAPLAAMLAASALLLAPLDALASPDAAPWASGEGEREHAVRRYKEGGRLLVEGRPAEALPELEASYALFPSPNTELLIAHALRLTGRKVEAIERYERVVGETGERVRAGEARFRPTLAEAGRWVALLRSELGEVEVYVEEAPEDTEVSIGGRPATPARGRRGALRARAFAEPGEVPVEVRGGGRTLREEVEVGAGRRRELSRSFDEPRPVSARRGGPPAASLALGGVGVLGLGAFTVFGLRASGAARELDACASLPEKCPRDPHHLDLAETGAQNATIANVSLAVGLAGLAAAGLVWWLDAEKAGNPAAAGASRPARLRVGLHSGGASLGGVF